MSNTINQERPVLGEPLVIPPENMKKKIMNMPIIPPINDMLMELLERNCVELFIPPFNPAIDAD